jgi:hypothetical protein
MYKNKNEFYSNKSLFWGISSECVECIKKDSKSGFRKQALIRSAIKNYEKIKERKRISAKHEYATDPSKIKTRNAKYTKKLRHELADRYVKEKLKNRKKYICQYTIELKRQQIIMIRTLKQFKQWRKEQENEPNHTDVYGKQFTDEENHEGRISA